MPVCRVAQGLFSEQEEVAERRVVERYHVPRPTGADDASQIARTRLANDHVPDLAWFIDPVLGCECRGMHGVGSDQP